MAAVQDTVIGGLQAQDAPRRGERDLPDYLRGLAELDGSDLFMTVGAPPAFKVNGVVRRTAAPALQPGEVRQLAYSVMKDAQIASFEQNLECDLALAVEPAGRFRINVYMQRGEVSLVARHVKPHVPTLAELNLPAPELQRLAMLRRGLVLAVGAAGSGKSTTIASMLDYRNRSAPGHILTIEDPIEFVHPHHLCIVDQREVGIDTHSYADALRHALREAPDVIVVGEIRDHDSMRQALNYAQTGHLCLATLHASNAPQAIERVINLYPESARQQVLLDLALNLRGVIAQRLVPGRGGLLMPATELMTESAFVGELIQTGRIGELKSAIGSSLSGDMHTFDESLYTLYREGKISQQQAMENADSRTDLSLRIRTQSGAGTPETHGMALVSRFGT